jgi:hypothetical protein
MQNFSLPLVPLPRTMASKLGEGSDYVVKMVGGSGIGAENLASPNNQVLCRVLICFLLTGNYSLNFLLFLR